VQFFIIYVKHFYYGEFILTQKPLSYVCIALKDRKSASSRELVLNIAEVEITDKRKILVIQLCLLEMLRSSFHCPEKGNEKCARVTALVLYSCVGLFL